MENSKEIVVFELNGDTFLFESEHLSRNIRIEIESLISGAWEDYEDELYEKTDFEILDWVINHIKLETGIEWVSVGIGSTFKMSRP